jgi:metal-responsive CopG/Arc/MetJ family transcriptional regulator
MFTTETDDMRKKTAGRPPKAQGTLLVQVPVRFPQPMVDEVDAERGARLDAPDRSAMIRELVAEALEARRRLRDKRR